MTATEGCGVPCGSGSEQERRRSGKAEDESAPAGFLQGGCRPGNRDVRPVFGIGQRDPDLARNQPHEISPVLGRDSLPAVAASKMRPASARLYVRSGSCGVPFGPE
jgi:hypothetical protein